MLSNPSAALGFSMPGGEICTRASARPIDLVHLSVQTMGDRSLEQEVLKLFLQQATTVSDRLTHADPKESQALAHSLRGSAGGVGAFAIADCAALIEADPSDRASKRRLAKLVGEVRDFIAAINR